MNKPTQKHKYSNHKSATALPIPGKDRLLVEVIERMRVKHLSPITQKEYANWIKRFIRFCELRHPATCSAREVERFLSHLAIDGEVSASTQNQALAAIVFLYKECLGIPLEGVDSLRAKRTDYVPVAFSKDEIERIFGFLDSSQRLKFELLYGCGLRLNELITLRVKDIDLEKKALTVFKAKGGKARNIPIPEKCLDGLRAQISNRKTLFDRDLKRGVTTPPPPGALTRKYPNIPNSFSWTFLFPSRAIRKNEKTNSLERWHIEGSSVQRALNHAKQLAGITKQASCHNLRHSFATHLLESGNDIRTIQVLMGHSDVRTTMIYAQSTKESLERYMSPLDESPAVVCQPSHSEASIVAGPAVINLINGEECNKLTFLQKLVQLFSR